MAPLITLDNISKRFGDKVLFSNLSFGISKGDKVGVIGPNGSGKSSLLKIITGSEDIDSGQVIKNKNITVSYVEQNQTYLDNKSVREIISLEDASHEIEYYLDIFKFGDIDTPASQISGGQKKKLQLAISFSKDSDVILLDEPSNHLDIDSIKELEKIISKRREAIIMISHDRWLLELIPEHIIEINSKLPDNHFMSEGNYGEYLEERALFLEAVEKNFDTLKNKVRQEVAWLRQGAKARSTKSKHRTHTANELITTLKREKSKRVNNSAELEFVSSGRKTKELLEFINISKSFDDKQILSGMNFLFVNGSKVAILGPNGSGKSTILKLINNELVQDSGEIKKASSLKISYFTQFSSHVDPSISLQRLLSPDGDSVVFNNSSIHVASWAKKFGFDTKALNQPYESLSGGEKAKARIANIMLESPDILLLDEPTNDLDIQTLEILEESLLEYNGALVLVSHDRYMLNKVCNQFIGLCMDGKIVVFSSYDQWEDYNQSIPKNEYTLKESNVEQPKANKIKLTYNEQRELSLMESNIEKAEKEVRKFEEAVSKADSQDMLKACEELGLAQKKVEDLYKRWEELEARK